MSAYKDDMQGQKEAWDNAGTIERGRRATCGICGCSSDIWRTIGNPMTGIRTVLVCPGSKQYPDLHEKISRKQRLLDEDALPETVLEQLVVELILLRSAIRKAQTNEPESKT